MKMIYILLLVIILPTQVFAKVEVDEIFKEVTAIKDPARLRDPFKAPKTKKIKEKKIINNKVGNGIYSNIANIGKIELEELKIIGVLIGKVRRAIAKIGKGKETYILKEGMKIGENNAELKAIVPGGVILVERITNIYGQEEYLETVVPISKEN